MEALEQSVCQQSFRGDRLFSVWQVHWQELFQLPACNSKQFCSCLSGVFLTIHKYTQHSGFATCAWSLLLYDILARSRVIRFPIVFALLPLRKRRSLREHIGSVNTFDVYYKSFYKEPPSSLQSPLSKIQTKPLYISTEGPATHFWDWAKPNIYTILYSTQMNYWWTYGENLGGPCSYGRVVKGS